MKITFYPYTLNLKRSFNLATGSRKTTPLVLVELEYAGHTGYGEASLPPYLSETQESVEGFLRKVNFNLFDEGEDIPSFLSYVDSIAPGNNAAKAAIDIALFDLSGKIKSQSCYELLNVEPKNFPITSYTISIDSPENLKERVKEAEEFKILKIKLGGKNDNEIIKTVTSQTEKLFSVDVNQGWKNKYSALDFIKMLEDLNCLYVEQPLPMEMIRETLWIADRVNIPIIADEAVKRLKDIVEVDGIYHGINIKLMKSTGLNEARKMINEARKKEMKIVVGSMTETSCGITAATHLSPLADWADLDSGYLISEDPFEGAIILEGKIFHKNNLPGLGIIKK